MNSPNFPLTSPIVCGIDRGSAAIAPRVTRAMHLATLSTLPMKRRWQRWSMGMAIALLTAGGWGLSAEAAEQITLKLGPVNHTVPLSELEDFAIRGEVPPSLKLIAPLMNHDVRSLMLSQLPLRSQIGDELVDDLLNTSSGERLLTTLAQVIPNSSEKDLRSTLKRASQHPAGLSLLGFLAEFPHETITIDLAAGMTMASQMNLPYWQSKALSSILHRELTTDSEPPEAFAFDPAQEGPHWVRQQTLYLHDDSRQRSIPVDVYWTRRTKGPLVVLSHGFGADRRFLGYLAHHLASHGFTAVAIEHPGSNVAWLTNIFSNRFLYRQMADILPPEEFVDRPQDVSFVLSELAHKGANTRYMRNKFNTEQVTVIGHSLGGYTALALAGARLNLPALQQFCDGSKPLGLSVADWLQCTATDLDEQQVSNLRDRRVRRVIALNPVMGRLFDQGSLSNIQIPMLVSAATGDAITPAISQQLLPFTHLQAEERYLLTAIGATHLSVGDPRNLNQGLTNSLLMRERPGQETSALRDVVRGVSLAFVQQDAPEAGHYRQFLTEDYARANSTEDLNLRLNTTLSDNLTRWLEMAALPLEQRTLITQDESHQGLPLQVAMLGSMGLLVGVPLVLLFLPGSWFSPRTRLMQQPWYTRLWRRGDRPPHDDQ